MKNLATSDMYYNWRKTIFYFCLCQWSCCRCYNDGRRDKISKV